MTFFDPLTGRELAPPGRPAGPQGVLGDPYNAPGALPYQSPPYNPDGYGNIYWPLPEVTPDTEPYDPYADWDESPDFGWDYGAGAGHPYVRQPLAGDGHEHDPWEPDDGYQDSPHDVPDD
jgi:hypothetical protein